MEVCPSEKTSEFQSCLQPIEKYLKIFKIVGGFPLSIHRSSIRFSKFEFLKLSFYMFLTGLVGHAFTIYAITLPEKNFNIYVEIFTSAGFSPMDFYMGSVMATVNFTSSIVAFVGLKRVSKKLEKLCQDLDRFNSRNHIYQEKMYTGKGNIKQYKNSN